MTDAVRDLTRHYEAVARNEKMAADGLPEQSPGLRRRRHGAEVEDRRRMWAEARAAAHAEVKRCQDAMEATLKVLDATLQVAALQKLDKKRESAAKEEVILIIGASSELALTILELAQRDDDIAAVVTNGTWPEFLLRSKGIGVQQAKDAAQQAAGSRRRRQPRRPTRYAALSAKRSRRWAPRSAAAAPPTP